jgi:hypothetical protein
MTAIVIWAALAVGGMLAAAVLAGIKNRDFSAWMAWGFLVPPVVLLLLLLPRNQGPRPRQPSWDEIG